MTVISKVSSNFLTYLGFQFNRTGLTRTVNKRTAGAAAKNRHADLDVFYFRKC